MAKTTAKAETPAKKNTAAKKVPAKAAAKAPASAEIIQEVAAEVGQIVPDQAQSVSSPGGPEPDIVFEIQPEASATASQTDSDAPLLLDQAINILVAEGFQVVKEDTQISLDNRPTVVIPYKKSAAAGEELRYALRAWEKYFSGCKIVVIGDREDWFSPELICIEMEVMSKNPQIDVAYKLMEAVAAEEIPENFIWSNDDILPVSPIHLGDIQLLKANGMLPATKAATNGMYAENKQRTIELLKKAGLPAWDYSTHTPFYFNKARLAEVIDRFESSEQGTLVSSLYFNSQYPEVVPIKVTGDANCFFTAYVYRDNPPMSLVNEVFKLRKFVNYNDKGYSAIKGVIESKYAVKSSFEI